MHEKFISQTEALRESLHDATGWYQQISKTTELIQLAFSQQKKVLVAGNGGSATIAQHFADEMVGRYRTNRPPLPIIALTADSAVLTCIGNDFGFEEIFSRTSGSLGPSRGCATYFFNFREIKKFIACGQTGNSTEVNDSRIYRKQIANRTSVLHGRSSE